MIQIVRKHDSLFCVFIFLNITYLLARSIGETFILGVLLWKLLTFIFRKISFQYVPCKIKAFYSECSTPNIYNKINFKDLKNNKMLQIIELKTIPTLKATCFSLIVPKKNKQANGKIYSNSYLLAGF